MRAAIIGTGLIGGSIGLALKSRGQASSIIGVDTDGATLERAIKLGAVDEGVDVEGAAARSDLVVVATPVDAIPAILARIAAAPGSPLVTDVGSTKTSITAYAASLGLGRRFIGGHPIAGAESSGVLSARADLFEGCHWILCPSDSTDAAAYQKLTQVLRSIGASVLALDAGRHDELVALTSHLPQVLSWALMGFASGVAAAPGGLPLVTAGGFRDMTRIALSSPELWRAILVDNRSAVSEVLGRFRQALEEVSGLIEEPDDERLLEWMRSAREARGSLPDKPGVDPAETAELTVSIPDRPGVLADVATALGEAGINIEDLEINHAPEGGSGALHLMVKRSSSQDAVSVLRGKGYEATVMR